MIFILDDKTDIDEPCGGKLDKNFQPGYPKNLRHHSFVGSLDFLFSCGLGVDRSSSRIL